MALIKRIQIANHLDSSSLPGRWQPDFRLLTMDLKGQSTAVVMVNGIGKTTIANGVNLLVTRHPELAKQVKLGMSPSGLSSYSHIRVEIVQPTDATDDMFVQQGMDVMGETWVYGVCGHKDGEGLKFYYYPGLLEDCPVGFVQPDRSIVLYTNQEFAGKRDNISGIRWEPLKDDYLRSLQPHFAAHATRRMLNFHLAGGGDKSAELYPISHRPGEKHDQALFMNALAPELISGITGEEGEDGEDSFEKTILISATKYVSAKLSSEDRKKKLENLRKTLSAAVPLRESAKTFIDRKIAWDSANKEASLELIVLKKLVDENVIPGIPQFPEGDGIEGSSQDYLLKGIVAAAESEEVLILDRALAAEIGVSVSQLNEFAARNELVAVPLSEMVISPEKLRTSSQGGKASKGYSQEDALRILRKNQQRFGSEDAAEKAVDRVKSAFSRWRTACDTNMFRKTLDVRQKERSAKETQIQGLDETFIRIENNLRILSEHVGAIEKGRAAWKAMRDSSLFTPDELKDPEETKFIVDQAYQNARKALNTHREHKAGLSRLLSHWQAFRSGYPAPTSPYDVREELNKQKDDLTGAVSIAEDAERKAGIDFESATRKHSQAERILQEITAERDDFVNLDPGIAIYEDIFGDENPVGLVRKVQDDKTLLDKQLSEIERALSAFKQHLEALAEFRAAYNLRDPEEVLRDVEVTRDAEVLEENRLRKEIEGCEEQLSGLMQNRTSPRNSAKKVFSLLGDLAPVHLLEHLNSLGLPEARRLELLTLFSNHLFAPVLDTPERAGQAVERLEKEDIPYPVFVASMLSDFARTGQVTSTAAGKVVYNYQAGVRSLTVEAIFDPRKIEVLKAQLNDRLSELVPRRKELKQGISLLADKIRMVGKAVDAVKVNAEGESRDLQNEQIELTSAKRQIDLRASHDALNAIEARIKFLSLGGYQGRERVLVALAQAKGTNNETVEACQKTKRNREQAHHALIAAKKALRLFEVEILPPAKLHQLEKAIEFVDLGGDKFMLTAEKQERSLSSAENDADKRRPFQFDLAAQFIKTEGPSWEDLEKEETRLLSQKEGNRREKEELTTQIHRINQESKQLRILKITVDKVAAEILKHYANKMHSLGHLLEENLIGLDAIQAKGGTTALMAAVFAFAKVVKEAKGTASIQNAAVRVGDSYSILDEKTGRIQSAKKAYDQSEGRYNEELDRLLGAAPEGLKASEISSLRRNQDDAHFILRLFDTLDGEFVKEEEIVKQILDSETRTRKDACERLATMAADARSNLKLLRKIFGQTPQSTFIVSADVLPEERIREIMHEILEFIEVEERSYREKTKAAARMHTDSERIGSDHRKTSLDFIRDSIYRSIFSNVEVKVVHPEMRAGKPFLYGQTISQGQRTAVGLMLMAKMAQFTMERDALRAMPSLPLARRRKVLAKSQSVMIFDGLFSNLTNQKIIREAMCALKSTKGHFQLIGLIHNPFYENDPEVFPSYITVKKLQEPGMNGGFLSLDENHAPVSPSLLGRRYGELESAEFHFQIREPEVATTGGEG